MTRDSDPHAAPEHSAEFRFYAELNDFLPPSRRQRSFEYRFTGTPAVKDAIEALGVPHTEVDLILIDGESAPFEAPLAGGARVAVFPMFESVDIGPLTRVRPEPLRVTRFIADVHLGTLARYLRLIGYDTVWRNDLDDDEIVLRAAAEKRIVLTRDRGILRRRSVTHGYAVRESDPIRQLEEIVRALDLGGRMQPFTRCLACNGLLAPLDRDAAAPLVPKRVHESHADFLRCPDCARVYWPGSHRARLDALIDRARAASRAA